MRAMEKGRAFVPELEGVGVGEWVNEWMGGWGGWGGWVVAGA